MNRADVRVLSRRRCLRLADEALLRGVVMAPLRRQELQRHGPTELAVDRFVDDTHTPASEAGNDVVMGDGPSDQGVGARVRHSGYL